MALLNLTGLFWIFLLLLRKQCMAASIIETSCCKRIGSMLNCANCGLTQLPISIMDENITTLDLSHNNIITIPNGSFEHMTSLKTLDISENPLQDLNKETFRGLSSVDNFAIGRELSANQQFTADTFSPLKNVTAFRLICFYPTFVNPGYSLHMKNLETLTVAFENSGILGKEISSLKRLKSLHIIAYNLKLNVTKHTLAAASQVETLTISRGLVQLSIDALKPLAKLIELKLILNPNFQLHQTFLAIKNMKSATLTKLILDGSRQKGCLFTLTSDMVDSPNFSNLTLLSLQRTQLVQWDAAILTLPTLKNVNVGFNSFGVNAGMLKTNNSTINSVRELTNIEAISASSILKYTRYAKFQNIYYKRSLDTFPQPPKWIRLPKHLHNTQSTIQILEKQQSNQTKSTDQIMEKRQSNRTKSNQIMVKQQSKASGRSHYIPLSLRFIYARHIPSTYFTMRHNIYRVSEGNNILYIDFSYSNINSKLELYIGLKKLQGINLAGCGLSGIHNDQLHHLPSLVYLNLENNNLDMKTFAKTLQWGSKLRWLDLSFNKIDILPANLLSGLMSLQSVSFRGNLIVKIALDLKNNTKLEFIDFSDCTLTNINDRFRHQLDHLQSNIIQNLKLNLSNNRFECSCSDIGMIHWFQHTKIDIIDRGSISCRYRNHTLAIVNLDIEKISDECKVKNKLWLTILVPLSMVVLLLGLVLLLYHFQWQVKWHFYMTIRKIRLALVRTGRDENLILLEQKFDAFISHDHSDSEWVTNALYDSLAEDHGFDLCLGQKDFLPGVPIAENIAHAIDNSRKIVLVVTPAFIESMWCLFEMHMALEVKGKDSIVVILKEEVPVTDMNKTLRHILRTITYIEYPGEENRNGEAFWNKLAEAIRI